MNIVAKDGKDGFRTTEECLKYEAELDRKEREKKEKESKLLADKKKDYDEILKLYNELVDKVEAYQKKYKVDWKTYEFNDPYSLISHFLPENFKLLL